MCRLVAYLGRPLMMDALLIAPRNSLINQSVNAQEIEEPLNGDGFGVGWYNQEIGPTPGLFTSITPAWNNRNLRSLAAVVKSQCFMAHVRAASVGQLAETNCHPFAFEQMLFAHNGDAPEFHRYKRELCGQLSDELYDWIGGQTDSEHLFALVIDALRERAKAEPVSADLVALAFEDMLRALEALRAKHRIRESAYLNMVATDGERMVGMRYVSDPAEDPLSLYYSEGSRYECDEGVCRMLPAAEGERAVMVVSEKLTEFAEDWRPIPTNHFLLVYKDLSVGLRAIRL